MNSVPRYLRNWQSVIAAYDYWPSFHDAHVLELSRAESGGLAQVHLTLHGFEMTPETDARGYFKLIKHHRVSFSFLLDESEAFQPRTEGNILLDLEFSSEAEFEKFGCFTVRLDSAIEGCLNAEFRARAGEVVSVVPCDGHGQ